MTEMIEANLATLVDEKWRHAFEDCTITFPARLKSRIHVDTPPAAGKRRSYRIRVCEEFAGSLTFLIGPGSGNVSIESAGPINASIRLWRNSSVVIRERTTITQARIVADHADIVVGKDGLWSDEILVQSHDQHGLIDVATGEVINGGRRKILIGDHVWIGRRATIMPGVEIGKGSVLATGAVLTSGMPENSVFAGVPARKIRDGISWSRSPAGLSDFERDLLGLH